MLNLAMYSASICLETMHKNSCKFKSVLLWISIWLYTHLTIEQLACMVKLPLSKDIFELSQMATIIVDGIMPKSWKNIKED